MDNLLNKFNMPSIEDRETIDMLFWLVEGLAQNIDSSFPLALCRVCHAFHLFTKEVSFYVLAWYQLHTSPTLWNKAITKII